ncbi:ATP-binding protein [Microbacterium sp. 22242]|uniref:ATP-binding protein n=1 Tax=Microbacterium sp. 22242 TaxID=3453896 RepID=UPI003F861FEA
MTGLGASPSLVVSAFGVRIRLDFADGFDPEAAERIRRSWAGAQIAADDPREPDEIILVVPEDDQEALAESLTVQVTLAALERRGGELVMFHACGVADPQGRVAAFVGPSGRGKTTLSRALGTHYGYVSDETVAVSPDLVVSPYRKPLSVVRAGRPKEQVSPDAAGLLPVPDAPLRLGALVLLTRDADHPAPTLESVAFPEAIAEIAPQMSYLAELPRPLQTLAALCDRIGGVVRLTYPDAATVPPVIPELLDHDRVQEEWQPAQIEIEHPEYDLSGVTDAIRCGDRVVVLAQRWVHVLDGIAPVIWESLRQGRRTAQIVDDVIAEFGRPAAGDPAELVAVALGQLADAKVLTRRD